MNSNDINLKGNNKGQEPKNISELKAMYSDLAVEVDELINSYLAKTPKGITPLILVRDDKKKMNCPKGEHLGFAFIIDTGITSNADAFLEKSPSPEQV